MSRRRALSRGEATSPGAEWAPVSGRTASDLEADYAKFGSLGRPFGLFAIISAGSVILFFAIGAIQQTTGNPSLFEPFLDWARRHSVEIWFTTPAFIAALRGRRYLRSITLGSLSPLATLGVGLGVGCTCTVLSTIFGLPHFHWPVFNIHGLSSVDDTPPITAFLLGPFGEEVIYQGGLQTWLQRYGPIAAVIGATVPFWGLHLYGGFVPMPVALIHLLPSILAFALVRQMTKSLGAAVLAHSTYNVLASVLTFAAR